MSPIPVHIEYFKDASEVLREKMFLAKALKSDGILIVNADDELFMKASQDLSVKKITFGSAKNADIKIVESGALYDEPPLLLPRGQYAVFDIHGRTERINIERVVGNHLIYPIAAAIALALVLNIKPNLGGIFKSSGMPRGRMRILAGKSKSIIIDDTYNSSPIACFEALKTLASLSVKGKKIAALADMKELGDLSENAHREIGKLAGETLHTLITVGEEAQNIALGARESGMSPDRILSFNTSTEAVTKLADILRAGDVMLIKGSQSMRMEKLTEALLEDPSKASELLVRQEEEWKNR
jgi:UDP-N-acetylmuramoyl-tripeptide--D-alanyl-D-alanine ligase